MDKLTLWIAWMLWTALISTTYLADKANTKWYVARVEDVLDTNSISVLPKDWQAFSSLWWFMHWVDKNYWDWKPVSQEVQVSNRTMQWILEWKEKCGWTLTLDVEWTKLLWIIQDLPRPKGIKCESNHWWELDDSNWAENTW